MKISYVLPKNILHNKDFEQYGWPADKIFEKTGIQCRHICGDHEFALDLAAAAGDKLFSEYAVNKEEVDFLLYCTQSPDFIVPNNASLLHRKLRLKKDTGSLDIIQGCSGYIYGLAIARGLLLAGQANTVLFITADCWSKYIHEKDKSTRSIFGDGATATLLVKDDALKMGDFVFGTDGSGAQNLWVKTSGLRYMRGKYPTQVSEDESGNIRTEDNLYMNGPEIFNFTLLTIPAIVKTLLSKSRLHIADIHYFVFHQANKFMLDHLRKKLEIPENKFPISIEHIGNTVSSSIPIVLSNLRNDNKLQPNLTIMLIGFGVGYSWAASILNT